MSVPIKFNNDILIPRSILKKNEVGPRDLTKMPESADFLTEYDAIINHGIETNVSASEGVVGRQLDVNGPLLSPKKFDQNYLEKAYRKMDER